MRNAEHLTADRIHLIDAPLDVTGCARQGRAEFLDGGNVHFVVPDAGVTTEGFFDHLIENFVRFDHAELDPRAFLDRINALLQVANLGVQARVAGGQLNVLGFLLIDLP